MNIDQIPMSYTYINKFVSTSSTNQCKAFFQFQISHQIIAWKLKNIQGVNIHQISMCYISRDLSRQDLQTNGKLFFKFELTSYKVWEWFCCYKPNRRQKTTNNHILWLKTNKEKKKEFGTFFIFIFFMVKMTVYEKKNLFFFYPATTLVENVYG